MVYFPEEVFKNIMEFVGDLKKEKQKLMWKRIKVRKLNTTYTLFHVPNYVEWSVSYEKPNALPHTIDYEETHIDLLKLQYLDEKRSECSILFAVLGEEYLE